MNCIKKYDNEQINNIVDTIIKGGYTGEYLQGVLGKYADMIDFEKLDLPAEVDKLEFTEGLAKVNDIRYRVSLDDIKHYVAYQFYDAYYYLCREIGDPFGFEYFLNKSGFPDYTLGAIDMKYLISPDEYIDIHRQCFDMLNDGAEPEDIANIL